MLHRLAIVIYSVGLLFGGGFFLSVLYILGENIDAGWGKWVTEDLVLSIIAGLISYSFCWAFRYVITGAKGISPMAKGKDEASVGTPENGETL